MSADQMDVLERLDRIEAALSALLKQRTVKDWYGTEEVAEILGKAEFTVREWCRLGRIHAEKRQSGRGAHPAWAVSHDELLRYQREVKGYKLTFEKHERINNKLKDREIIDVAFRETPLSIVMNWREGAQRARSAGRGGTGGAGHRRRRHAHHHLVRHGWLGADGLRPAADGLPQRRAALRTPPG